MLLLADENMSTLHQRRPSGRVGAKVTKRKWQFYETVNRFGRISYGLDIFSSCKLRISEASVKLAALVFLLFTFILQC